jgi:hypothetical protein
MPGSAWRQEMSVMLRARKYLVELLERRRGGLLSACEHARKRGMRRVR